LGNLLPIAFSLLIIAIAVVPVLVFLDGHVANSVIGALAAAALASIAVSARAADVYFAGRVTRYLKFAAAIPAIWMAIQILPTPFPKMSHSIWINANEALGRQSLGHVSVDIGKTAEALAFYLANVSLIIIGLFVAKDRRRAELILLALAGTTTLTTIALLVSKQALIAGFASSQKNELLSAVSSIGIMMSLATSIWAIERRASNRVEPARNRQSYQMTFALCGAGFLICIVGLAISATLNVGLTVAFGVVAFGSVQVIRRFGPAGWVTGIFIATIITAATMIALWRHDPASALSPYLQFATAASADAISAAQRILSDTGWLGTGAATYASILPIYGSSITTAPSSAAAFAIELGWPMALFTFGTAIGLVAVLYRGALFRRRDSYYPAAAAACVIMILGQAFCDASLLHPVVAVIAGAVTGLGLAQSVSQGNGRPT
jgi:hypothetical protein